MLGIIKNKDIPSCCLCSNNIVFLGHIERSVNVSLVENPSLDLETVMVHLFFSLFTFGQIEIFCILDIGPIGKLSLGYHEVVRFILSGLGAQNKLLPEEI